MMQFIKGHVKDFQRGGTTVSKIKLLFRKIFKLPLYGLAIPAVLIMRLIRPWLLVRLGGLISTRIGHFAANTELYLCENKAGINVPSQRYIDIFYMDGKPVCNCSGKCKKACVQERFSPRFGKPETDSDQSCCNQIGSEAFIKEYSGRPGVSD